MLLSLLGPPSFVEVFDLEFDRWIRIRYERDIGVLRALGFHYLCGYGESLSLLRLPLLFPAVLLVSRYRRHVPMTLDGPRVISGFPLLVSADRTTYGVCGKPGFKLMTAFTDGTILVTENFADPYYGGPRIVKNSQPSDPPEVWAAHRQRIESLLESGKRVHRDASYHAFVDACLTEWAPW
jgi:hypothetical protein